MGHYLFGLIMGLVIGAAAAIIITKSVLAARQQHEDVIADIWRRFEESDRNRDEALQPVWREFEESARTRDEAFEPVWREFDCVRERLDRLEKMLGKGSQVL